MIYLPKSYVLVLFSAIFMGAGCGGLLGENKDSSKKVDSSGGEDGDAVPRDGKYVEQTLSGKFYANEWSYKTALVANRLDSYVFTFYDEIEERDCQFLETFLPEKKISLGLNEDDDLRPKRFELANQKEKSYILNQYKYEDDVNYNYNIANGFFEITVVSESEVMGRILAEGDEDHHLMGSFKAKVCCSIEETFGYELCE